MAFRFCVYVSFISKITPVPNIKATYYNDKITIFEQIAIFEIIVVFLEMNNDLGSPCTNQVTNMPYTVMSASREVRYITARHVKAISCAALSDLRLPNLGQPSIGHMLLGNFAPAETHSEGSFPFSLFSWHSSSDRWSTRWSASGRIFSFCAFSSGGLTSFNWMFRECYFSETLRSRYTFNAKRSSRFSFDTYWLILGWISIITCQIYT